MRNRESSGKKFVLVLLTAAFVLTAPPGAWSKEKGTGVGNGGNSNRDQYLERLRLDMGPRLRIGAGQLTPVLPAPEMAPLPGGIPAPVIAPGISPLTELSAWCARIVSILRRELRRAEIQVQYQRLVHAEQILVDALVTAGQSLEIDPTLGGPMTKLLIDRGLQLSQALDATLGGGLPIDQHTKLAFLFDWTKLIITMERDLDRPWYLPYRYRYGACHTRCAQVDPFAPCWETCAPDFRFADFHRQYVQYAGRQLEFVAKHFTDVIMRDGRLSAIPIGNPRAFLKVAELVSGFVAWDLSNNLYAYANACRVRDLLDLSTNLQAFNMFGDTTYFPNMPWAVASTREELDRIAQDVGQCRY